MPDTDDPRSILDDMGKRLATLIQDDACDEALDQLLQELPDADYFALYQFRNGATQAQIAEAMCTDKKTVRASITRAYLFLSLGLRESPTLAEPMVAPRRG